MNNKESLMQLVQQEKKKYFDEMVKRLRYYRDENMKSRDEFAAERTYKLSNLIISLNVGIIGAMSFLLIKTQEIRPFSKFLVLVLILPIFSIIFEIFYKRKVLEVNREAADRRVDLIPKFVREEVIKAFLQKHENFEEFKATIEDLDKREAEEFDKINNWIRIQEKKGNWLRVWSLELSIITLIGIILIVLIETGVVLILFGLISSIKRFI